MSNTTYVYGYVDDDDITKARTRLAAFMARHKLDLDHVTDHPRWGKDAAGDVNLMLNEIDAQCCSYDPNPHGCWLRGYALKIFQRAVGDHRARFLHHDSAGYIQYAR